MRLILKEKMKAPLAFLLISFLILASHSSKAQITLSYHVSDVSFVGVNTMIGNRFMPELRLGVNQDVEDVDVELNVFYLFKRRPSLQWYGGAGIRRSDIFEGLAFPTGLNIYPFERKNLGFQMEVAGLYGSGRARLRGSVGIRYRFDKKDKKRK